MGMGKNVENAVNNDTNNVTYFVVYEIILYAHINVFYVNRVITINTDE